MATLTQLTAKATALGNYATADSTNIDTFVNMAYLDVCKRRRWSWLETTTSISTVAGTATVAVPAAVADGYFGRLRPDSTSVTAPEYIPDWEAFDYRTRDAVDTTDRGEPKYYSIMGGSIYFYPTPDAVYAYTLPYWRSPAALTSGTEPLIPETFHDVLVYGALMLHAGRDKDGQMYSFWQDQYEGQIEELRRRDLSRTQQTKSRARMPDTYGQNYKSPVF
jgi:hypothetical protein